MPPQVVQRLFRKFVVWRGFAQGLDESAGQYRQVVRQYAPVPHLCNLRRLHVGNILPADADVRAAVPAIHRHSGAASAVRRELGVSLTGVHLGLAPTKWAGFQFFHDALFQHDNPTYEDTWKSPVPQVIPESRKKAARLLRCLADIAERDGLADFALTYRTRNGDDDYALTGRYLDNPTEALKAALLLSRRLTELEEQVRGKP